MEGISESEDDITDIVPLVTVCKISNDLELRWTHGTLAYVETLDEDKAEYVWSQSRIAAGGQLSQKLQLESQLRRRKGFKLRAKPKRLNAKQTRSL